MPTQRDKKRAKKLATKPSRSSFDEATAQAKRQKARDKRDASVNNKRTRDAGKAPTTPGSEFREGEKALDVADRLDQQGKKKKKRRK